MFGSVGATLLGFLLQIMFDWTAGQQLLLARPQRSLFEAPLEHLEHQEHLALQPALPPLGWNTVGGGLGLGLGHGGEWAYNPVGLGHMTKDELLTLLEAWKEVEQESATTTTAAPPPVETTTRRPVRPRPPLPPPPPPRPRPIPIPIPLPQPAPGPQLPPGTPITVRLPAFVPIRLAAMWTAPAGGAGIAGGAGADAAPAGDAAAAGDDDLATDDAPDNDAAPRLFRFMPMPMARARPQTQPRQQFVVRNTLDSVDAGTAPVRTQVKPEIKPKIEVAAAAPPSPKVHDQPAPFFRPRTGLPPHLANARFELVPSSQIIGDWRE